MELPKFSHLTILLVDDQPALRFGLKNIIRLLGFKGSILEAGNGKEVLDLNRQYTVDLFNIPFR